MTTERPVTLLLSNRRDTTTDLVVRRLRVASVPFLRLNSDDIATWRVSVSPDRGSWVLARDERSVDLADVRNIWFRRPDADFISDLKELRPADQAFARTQWAALVRNLELLPASWMNLPGRNRTAESKLLQLRYARECGLPTPRTLVTNDRAAALEFAADCRRTGCVAKGLYAPAREEGGVTSFVYTRRVSEADLSRMSHSELIPFVLQEALVPKRDVRITVIDDSVVGAVAAIPQDSSEVDWRAVTPRVEFEPYDPPQDIATRLLELADRLGLRFMAADFALLESETLIFLETNANGEWGWLEQAHGIDISSAIARALVRSDPR